MKKLLWTLLVLAVPACTDQPAAPLPFAVLQPQSITVAERTDISLPVAVGSSWSGWPVYDSVPDILSSAVAFRGTEYVSNLFGTWQLFHFVALAPGSAVVLFRYADGTPAARQTINVHRVATALRVLKTLSLAAGQGVDFVPGGQFEYDSLPLLSSVAVVFRGMRRDTLYSPEGPMGQAQVYRFTAMAVGPAVVTFRYIDGTAAVQDTINVRDAVPHGRFAQVTAGLSLSTCAVTTQGGAYCWGSDGSPGCDLLAANGCARPIYDVPEVVPGGLAFATISGGGDYTVYGGAPTCGLTTGGAVYCWGVNDADTLGPSAPIPGTTFKAVSAGLNHSCAVTTEGAVYCWGSNSHGQLGNGSMEGWYVPPTLVFGGLTFATVGAGDQYSCGLTNSGAAYCWGYNPHGELGNPDTTSTGTPAPVPVAGGLSFAALTVGANHACGLTSSGKAYCWGWNGSGELGNGTTAASSTPVAVSGGLTFASVSAGVGQTCGVTTGGAAYCWGTNGFGQLGSTTNAFTGNPNPRPLPVSGGAAFTSVSAGNLHTCGVTTGGTIYCWGDDSEGELGDGSTAISSTPVPVFGP